MPTTFVNTIDETEILAKRSQCDYAGNDIQTTYATKSELPTTTSDLTNDSDFITSSDIPVKDVQVGGESVVNAQGIAEISIPQTGVLDVEVDGSSVVNAQGVAEITLPTFTQVNADWDASSGVSEILNKPDLSIYAESSDLATVATSGSYNDLLDKPSIPSAQVNADWDATSGVSEILNKPNLATVATTGDYSDLQNLPSIPAAQVNSDWSATSGVAQILNKPTIPSVDQSYSASSTNAQSGVAVAQAIASIPSPSYTAGNGIDITSDVISAKVDGTTVSTNASGELTVIGGGGGSQVNSDWDATSGVAEILNKPDLVDIVAGPGIVVDNPDGNTLRVSMAQDVETVLWNDAAGAFAATLNESLFNFEKIKVFQLTETTYHIQEFYTSDLTSNTFTIGATYQAAANQIYCFSSKWSITNSGVNIESTGKGYGLVGTSSGFTFYPRNVYNGKICRVVGIHRIANN